MANCQATDVPCPHPAPPNETQEEDLTLRLPNELLALVMQHYVFALEIRNLGHPLYRLQQVWILSMCVFTPSLSVISLAD